MEFDVLRNINSVRAGTTNAWHFGAQEALTSDTDVFSFGNKPGGMPASLSIANGTGAVLTVNYGASAGSVNWEFSSRNLADTGSVPIGSFDAIRRGASNIGEARIYSGDGTSLINTFKATGEGFTAVGVLTTDGVPSGLSAAFEVRHTSATLGASPFVRINNEATAADTVRAMSFTQIGGNVLGAYGYLFRGGTAAANRDFDVFTGGSTTGTPTVTVTGDGFVGIQQVNPTAVLDVAAGSSAAAAMRLRGQSADPTTPNLGDFWVDSSGLQAKMFSCNQVQVIEGSKGNQTSSVTVVSTTTETTLFSGASAWTAGAGFFVAGRGIRLTAHGYFSRSNTTDTIRFKVKLGSTIILDSLAFDPHVAGTITNQGWKLTCDIVCRTTGASGTLQAEGLLTYSDDSSSVTQIVRGLPLVNTGTVTYDTTASNSTDLTAQWSVASTSNTITCTNAQWEIIG